MEDAEMKEKLNKIIGSFDFSPKYQVDVMGRNIDVPVKYADASALMVFFSASLKKARQLLNSNRLSPVCIMGGRCLLGVTFFNYRDCPAGAYHEFTFSIPVIVDAKFNIPIAPLVFNSVFKKFGYYVILMGADTDMGKKHIEEIFPYPLFAKAVSINLSEKNKLITGSIYAGEEEIISVALPIPKSYKLERKGYNTYYSKNDKIYNVRLNTFSYNKMIFGMKDADFSLGNHEISKMLKGLDLSARPFFAIYYKKATEVAGGPQEV